ncbi:MarR family winged helix-turn-helix transcriptional regulator [Motilibacter aurantiacus]|uniref:MarR family winged helix-turn-helix transcriptional regulator n=1 Tax=Motilibacter aurantiacus TaxID=2714955 RepID=UPI00140A70EC|nr:MarR family transcriptional regulator [Motilibacter aurantiacus]NHC45673.1 MarR family transcriptional regulator [Motilibacter aurantiacus]
MAGTDPVAYEIAETMRALQWRLRRSAGAEVEDLGITPAQARALRTVARFAEPPSMGALAERLHIGPRSATDLVDPLEQSGLLRREQDPANRRSYRVHVTPEGERVHGQLRRRAHESAVRAFGVLGEDERATLLALLRRVVDALPAADCPAPGTGQR